MKPLDFIGATQRKDTKTSVAKSHDEAMNCRRREFWRPILSLLFYGYGKDPNPDPVKDLERYKNVRSHMLHLLSTCTAELAAGKCPLPLVYSTQRRLFEVVMFVAAFDPSFKFTPEKPEDAQDPVDSDVLSGEAAFQVEIWTALENYLLEGARLARRVNSLNYLQWDEALIRLSDITNGLCEKSEMGGVMREIMQLMVDAQRHLWVAVKVSQTNHSEKEGGHL